MTCIVGLVEDGKVFIGADSAAVSGWERRNTALPKVFQNGPFVIGYTTSFRMGQLLQHFLEVREQGENEDDLKYMVCAFIEAVRSCLKDHGFSEVNNNREKGGVFLVGYCGHLYSVHEDFQINEAADGFDACGVGREYALGALRATSGDPEARITKSLAVAGYFSMGVSGPYRVISI